MKYQKTLLLSASCFLLALLCSILWAYQKDGNLTERIAPQILRFHVLANSNGSRDQQIKAEVKTLLLETLKECPAGSKAEFCSYIEEHRSDLEHQADTWLAARGCDYHTSVSVTRAYFPTKVYGDLILPCGTYDTVQVRLGQGRGRNWWCVLYPRLCFVDGTHAIVPEDSREQLKLLLSDEDYEVLWETPHQVRFRIKLLELAQSLARQGDH